MYFRVPEYTLWVLNFSDDAVTDGRRSYERDDRRVAQCAGVGLRPKSAAAPRNRGAISCMQLFGGGGEGLNSHLRDRGVGNGRPHSYVA